MYNNKKINFKTFEKIVNINIIETKRSYYHNTFRNYKNNMKKPWRIINKTLGKRNQKNNLPNKLKVMQNAALRTSTGCTQDTNIQHLHDETLTLPILEYL